MRYKTIQPKFILDSQQRRLFAEFKIKRNGKDKYIRVIIPLAMWQEEEEYKDELKQ